MWASVAVVAERGEAQGKEAAEREDDPNGVAQLQAGC